MSFPKITPQFYASEPLNGMFEGGILSYSYASVKVEAAAAAERQQGKMRGFRSGSRSSLAATTYKRKRLNGTSFLLYFDRNGFKYRNTDRACRRQGTNGS